MRLPATIVFAASLIGATIAAETVMFSDDNW